MFTDETMRNIEFVRGLFKDNSPIPTKAWHQEQIDAIRARHERAEKRAHEDLLIKPHIRALEIAMALIEDLAKIQAAAVRCASHGSHPAESPGFAADYAALRAALKLEGEGNR